MSISRRVVCDFTRWLAGFLKDGFDSDLHVPYLMLTPSDLSDNVVAFRVPGYTAGYLKVSGFDVHSLSKVSRMVVDDVVLFDRSASLSSFLSTLTPDLLRNQWTGAEIVLEEMP